MKLNLIKPSSGSKFAAKRVGRGPGSGNGKTAGRGMKGQKSRSGGFHKIGFEGGQMPIHRRLPKRGFRSRVNINFDEIRLSELSKISGDQVDISSLRQAGIINANISKAKIILSGSVNRAFVIIGVGVTKGARAAIEDAGGRIGVAAP